MSPLIGAILLIGGTVMLAAVVGPFIFSTTSSVGDDTPTVDLRFAYSEDVDFEGKDTYGTTGDAAGADGLLTITLEDGDQLEANRINVSGGASGGGLTDGSYSDGETLSVGDSVTVWVNRGDQIDVLWNDESEDQSKILDTFTVFPMSTGLPGVPEPDYDCSGWSYPSDFDAKSGITADSNDLQINGVVLECDLSTFSNIPNVEISSNGGVIGNIEADGNVKLLSGSGVWGGFVETTNGNNVELYGNSEIEADVDSDQNLKLNDGSVIKGTTTLNGDLDLKTNSEIQGDLNIYDSDGIDLDNSIVRGDVNINTDQVIDADNSIITGNINLNDPDAGVNNLDNVRVDGAIDGTAATNNGYVELQNGSTTGPITTEGRVEVIDHSTVEGDLVAASTKDTKINDNSTVEGSVDADGTVILNNDYNVVVEDLDAPDLDCKDSTSTINGQPCSDYKDPNFDVTIDSTNSPVPTGYTLNVTFTVENTGIDDGTQQIELLNNSVQEDATTETINGGQSKTFTLNTTTINSDGTYNLTVASEDDWEETTGTVDSSVPPGFTDLSVTLTDVNSGENKKAEFDYSIQYDSSPNVEFQAIDDTGTVVDSTWQNGTVSQIWEWNHATVAQPMKYKININPAGSGECYEIEIPSGSSQGKTYNVLILGTAC